MGKVILIGFLFALTSCRHGRCYRDADCNKALVCLDPDAKEVPAAKRCAENEVRCVMGCMARCTAGGCGESKVCGESGCCEARPCKLNGDCKGEDSCVDKKCASPGRCMEPSDG